MALPRSARDRLAQHCRWGSIFLPIFRLERGLTRREGRLRRPHEQERDRTVPESSFEPSPGAGRNRPGASPPITEAEAQSIGVDAYMYFYPLISMDITRKQSTNIEAGKEFGKGPMNTFVNIPAFPPADLKVVVRVNFDTLYSIAWLDLTREPQVVSAPDTAGRYYLLPMLDMWTDVYASPGWRTTGTQAGNFLVTPPGWTGTVPAEHDADRGADAVFLGDRPDEDRRPTGL